jgi:hypothetical protein
MRLRVPSIGVRFAGSASPGAGMLADMRTLRSPIQRAEALAADQEGAIATFQARAAGMSQDQIDHQVRIGRWRRPVRGVLCVAGSPDTSRQRIVVAFLATSRAGGTVSHISATSEWGLLPPSPLPHVSVPMAASNACRGAKVHRSDIAAVDRTKRNGVWVTSVSRTIVDIAGIVDRAMVEQVVDDALCRRLASVRSIEAAQRRAGGKRGAALLRAVLTAWQPGVTPGSPAEVRLIRRMSELGLDGLVRQHEVHDDEGSFVARLDLADPARRKALEYEGVEPHNPRRWERDEARYARLLALGWDLETVGKLDLLPGEPRLAAIARRWLA